MSWLHDFDELTDLHLPTMIDWFENKTDKTAVFMAYQPTHSFHIVQREDDGAVKLSFYYAII
jgi:glucose-1-phosphate cytidylyltransferase